ncbi:MAG: carbohydrate kinase [Candidatus Firestonebacteria bacterium]|nr:carbohydrate kinase [Candidatus Firestonebacteria bacterium]
MSPRVLVPGSVLLDIYADTGARFLGGAEFNFAYHVHQLGMPLDFLARVGDDETGRFILTELSRRGFPTAGIQTDPVKPSKTVVVQKNSLGQPSYCIPVNVASEYLEFPAWAPGELEAYDLVYFGTSLQHGLQSRTTLRRLLAQSRGIKFCDLNLRPPRYTEETVAYSLQICDFLKLNHEELDVVARLFDLAGNPRERLSALARRFDLDGICLTLAEQGSLLLQGGRFYEKRLLPTTVVDTVGAGDAFSAMLVVGLLQGWAPEKLLEQASDLAAAVCQIQGAVSAEKEFYQAFVT